MKTLAKIFGALATAILYPKGWSLSDTHVFAVAFFLIFRVLMAVAMVPVVMISGMASDSGTAVALNGAYMLMYAMSLLMWAALLWSWRCVAVSVGIIASIFIFLPVFNQDSPGQLWMSRVLLILCFVATEAFLAPVRTILYFVLWCFSNDDSTNVAELIPSENDQVELLQTTV